MKENEYGCFRASRGAGYSGYQGKDLEFDLGKIVGKSNTSKKSLMEKGTNNLSNVFRSNVNLTRSINEDLRDSFKTFFIREYVCYCFKTLKTNEILIKINNYEKLFNNICLEFANKLNELLTNDYINIVPEYKAYLSKLFSFRIDKALGFIRNGDSNVMSPKNIKRMISEINEEKNTLKNLSSNQKKKIKNLLNFLNEYLIFSKRFYRNGFNTIFSQIKFVDDSKQELEPRSWLIENIRHVFPRFYGIPLSNTLLTYFLFGDEPNSEGYYKLTKILKIDRRDRRPHPYELFSIEYRVNRLTRKDFLKNHIDINEDQLSSIKKVVSYIIFKFIFSNFYHSPYITKFTSSGIPVGKYYWIPEFYLIKALYFSALDSNNTDSITFEETTNFYNLKRDFGGYLTDGIGLGIKALEKIIKKVKTMTTGKIYCEDLILEIKRFKELYYKRRDILSSALGFSSYFQLTVHYFFEKNFGLEFSHDRPIQSITGSKCYYKGMDIKISNGFHFDGLAVFTQEFRTITNINQRWKGIVFEAHGSWHTDKDQFQERWDFSDEEWENRQFIDNELKPYICKQNGFVYIEIHEDLTEEKWIMSVIEQFNAQTDLNFTEDIFPLKFK